MESEPDSPIFSSVLPSHQDKPVRYSFTRQPKNLQQEERHNQQQGVGVRVTHLSRDHHLHEEQNKHHSMAMIPSFDGGEDGGLVRDVVNHPASGSFRDFISRAEPAYYRTLPPEPSDGEDDITPIGAAARHFSHRHDMPVYALRRNDGFDCKFCSLRINGKAYGCKACRYFLHELCFGIPQYIAHVAHSAHPLLLTATKNIVGGDFTCQACDLGTEQSSGDQDSDPSPVFTFHYRCKPCQFALHVTCAAVESTITLKEEADNPFTLYTHFPLKNECADLTCGVCKNDMMKDKWAFFNRNSTNIYHFPCLSDKVYGDINFTSFIAGVKDRLANLQAGARVNKIDGIQYNQINKLYEICHRHILQKWNPMPELPPCQLCAIRITGNPYGCRACKFYFCENCINIPTEIQHPSHMEHRLVLTKQPDDSQLLCAACKIRCIQFCYYCAACKYIVHLQQSALGCSAYPKSLDINVSGGTKQFDLVFSFPYGNEALNVTCNGCGGIMKKDVWMYHNWDLDMKYHLECAARKATLDKGWKAMVNRLITLQVD